MDNSYKEKLVEYVFTQLQNGEINFKSEYHYFGVREEELKESKYDLIYWLKREVDSDKITKEIISKFIDYKDMYDEYGEIYDIESEIGLDECSDFWMVMKDYIEIYYDELSNEEYEERYSEIDKEMDRRCRDMIEMLEYSITEYLEKLLPLSEDGFYSLVMFGKDVFKDTVNQ